MNKFFICLLFSSFNFHLIFAQCGSCPGNLVQNPGFENGTTGWTWSGGNLSAGGGAVVCGSYSGDFQITNPSNNWVSQTVGTDLPAGTVIYASTYAGTHDNNYYHELQIGFFDANWVFISNSAIEVNKVLSASPSGPQLYTWNGTVPAGCKYTTVGWNGTGDWLKTEQWCVTTNTPPAAGCPGNLLSINYGFEYGMIDWNNWGNMSTTTTTPYAGTYAGYVTGGAGGGSSIVAGNAGWTYKLKAYAKIASGTSWGAIEMHFYNASMTEIAGSAAYTQVTSTAYQQYTVTATAPAGTAFVEAALWKDVSGSMWVDDYCLTSVATPCNGNLIANQSFENGMTDWNNYQNMTIAAVPHTGSYASLVPSGVAGGGTSDTLSAIPGNIYNLSVYAKAVNSASVWAVVEIEFLDASWNLVQAFNQVVNTTTYQQYNITGVAPAGAVMVRASMWKDVWGDLYTDDWCLTVTPPAGTVSLGNYVFQDRNGNGIKDAIDWGLDGVLVRLYADANDDGIADGAALADAYTSYNGFYNFTGLAPGKYFARLENISSSMFVCPVNGGDPDNNIDNDNNGLSQVGTTVKGGTINLTVAGEPNGLNYNGTYDFGLFKTNGLGDVVWLDDNANGIQDGGEPGLGGVKIYLKNPANNVILDSTVSDANGAYFFYDPAGLYGINTYNIQFVTPAGYSPSPANSGADDTKDSDPVNGTIVNASVPNGTYNRTFDAGFVPLVAVGDRVYYDANNNGFREAAETGIAGVTVYLYRDANNDNVADGASIATTTTNASGNYLFSNLLQGNYIVGIIPPANYYSSTINAGDPDSNTDLDNNGITVDQLTREIRGYAISLAPGTEFDGTSATTNTNITYDFALTTGTIKLGDYLWHDVNKNGIQDAGEPGIANQLIILKSVDKTGEIAKVTTDVNGYYLFNNMAPGNYYMKFPGLYHMVPTFENTGSNPARNSKANIGGWAPVTLSAGIDNLDVDAGYYTGWSLPVQSITLTPVLKANQVEVNWNTLNEVNTAYFEVERSYGNNSFTTIGKVNSTVSNGGNGSYRFIDNSFATSADVVTYRIKVIDKDAGFSYSGTAVIRLNKKAVFTTWPNPFVNEVTVSYTSAAASKITLSIIDMSGKKLKADTYKTARGNNRFSITNLADLPAGMYTIEIADMNTNERFIQKLTK